MKIEEIKAEELNTEEFIKEKVEEISRTVGKDSAITALSGGIDSSVVTMLGHRALGSRRLKTCFVDNGLMRENEPQNVVSLFAKLGIDVELVDAEEEFFAALKGITDPEEKREAITQTFYKKDFGRVVKESGSKCLLQGTILTDIDETAAGIKRQHNVFEQIGIDPEEMFGYKIIEPLVQLRKDGVKKVAKALGLPESIYNRMPFPGPALATRVLGEATPERIELVREATAITEEKLKDTGAFQYMAILHQDKVTGIRDGKRAFGLQIEIRCWDSVDARTGMPTRLPFELELEIGIEIPKKIPEVVSVTFSRTPKGPSTIEAV